jgi:hypothetical protein
VPLLTIAKQPVRVRRHAVVTGVCTLLGLAVGANAGIPSRDRQWLNQHAEPSRQQLAVAMNRAAAAREYTVIGASRGGLENRMSTPSHTDMAQSTADPVTFHDLSDQGRIAQGALEREPPSIEASVEADRTSMR